MSKLFQNLLLGFYATMTCLAFYGMVYALFLLERVS